jgi:hypothetical protein
VRAARRARASSRPPARPPPPSARAAAPPPFAAVTRTLEADVVYGTHALLRGPYVAVVTRSARAAAAPNGAPILRVLDMEWLLVGSGFSGAAAGGARPARLTAEEEEEEATYLALLAGYARAGGLYWSAGYDLTLSVQRADAAARGGEGAPEPARDAPPALALQPGWVARSDERFLWNRLALREMAATPAGAAFTAPFISGFVGAADGAALDLGGAGDARLASLLLLSRRAVARQGLRFIARGADADGNVANFAETEQVLVFRSGAVVAFVQTRGSIPLLWEQPATCKYTPRVHLAAWPASFAAFSRHAAAQARAYGRVTAVSLIDKKGDQLKLGRAFEEASAKIADAGAAGGGAWAHVWFDFHHECRKMRWENLAKLLAQVGGALAADGVFAAGGGGARATQRGVLRTNCLDNLDRTNVVQSIFARAQALAAVPGAADAARAAGSSVLTSPFPAFEAAFNGLWADNADALSRLYSGTGALKTDFTRTGKRTLRGLLADGANSAARYVLNNFADGRTQDALDLFLGRFVPERARGAARAARPHKRHLASSSPRRVLGGAAALWLGLTLALATVVPALVGAPRGADAGAAAAAAAAAFPLSLLPSPAHLAWGGAGALAAVLGLANAIIVRGAPAALGRALVCRPSFVVTGAAAADAAAAVDKMT